MIAPITTAKQALIVKNVVAACKNINKLNKTGYDFIYGASGFIAHYNLGGFVDHYNYDSLASDIKSNKNNNQWNNFRFGENNYEYYMSKKDVYNAILAQI